MRNKSSVWRQEIIAIIKILLQFSLSQHMDTDGNAIGTAGAIAPPQKDESILVGTTLTMETILCLIKAS